MLEANGLRFTFYNDKKVAKEHTLHLYERNLACRGLDFDDHPDDKVDFVRYAIELRCWSPIVDINKNPLPPLEDLADVVDTLIAVGMRRDMEPHRGLEKLLQTEETTRQ